MYMAKSQIQGQRENLRKKTFSLKSRDTAPWFYILMMLKKREGSDILRCRSSLESNLIPPEERSEEEKLAWVDFSTFLSYMGG